MRKLFSLFAALTLSVGLWAETVSYLYPVYNDPTDVTKGIASWQTSSKEAAPISSSSSSRSWGADGVETWLVVNENVTISKRVICYGEVHLILADNAKLTVTKGITVSGESNSLTIYAQSTGTQMGQLIANATSVYGAAGIGGGEDWESGSNITINGGEVTATGGDDAAGIGGGWEHSGSNITINGGKVTATSGILAAGIGGGDNGSASGITINGGEVTATGGDGAAGIGGGFSGSGSDIFVATTLQVKADGNNPPTAVIENNGGDLASSLAGKQYATIEIDITSIKAAAIAAVNDAIAEGDNLYVKEIATRAVSFINEATNVEIIEALKTQALSNIASARAAYGEGVIAGYNTGHAAGEEAGIAVGQGIGYQQAKDELPTEGDCGPTVIITKGDKTVTFYNTDKVEYSIVDAD